MRNIILTALVVILSSCKKDNFEITILNSSVSTSDSIRLKLYNNTNEEYLFYFKNSKLDYNSDNKNIIIADISAENEAAKIEISSDPLYMLNEDGTFTDQDIEEMEKYKKLATKRILRIVSPQSSIVFTVPFIDSTNIRGGKTYPILANNKRYDLRIKMDIDTNVINKKELENIRFKYRKKIHFFQGKLVSKPVNLK